MMALQCGHIPVLRDAYKAPRGDLDAADLEPELVVLRRVRSEGEARHVKGALDPHSFQSALGPIMSSRSARSKLPTMMVSTSRSGSPTTSGRFGHCGWRRQRKRKNRRNTRPSVRSASLPTSCFAAWMASHKSTAQSRALRLTGVAMPAGISGKMTASKKAVPLDPDLKAASQSWRARSIRLSEQSKPQAPNQLSEPRVATERIQFRI